MIRVATLSWLVTVLLPCMLVAGEPIDIGSRRELFVDDYLVHRLDGGARLVVQNPVPREVVLVTDKPWEGSSCLYFTIFCDGDLYRMYAFYRDAYVGFRSIRTATSRDFLHWSDSRMLGYRGARRQHLYTNAIQRYDRAPHLLIGFPTRFLPRNQFPDRPEWTEPILIAGRDGRSFRLWNDPIIPANSEATSGNRSNYVSWGLVQLPGKDREYSLYAAEDRRTGTSMRLRRYTYRTDGFVSVTARDSAGELRTKPLRFTGGRLAVNLATQPGGSVRVELQDAAGKPIPGFALANCNPLDGDHIAHDARWRNASDLSELTGKPIRLRFVIRDADLYSFQFQ